MSEMIKKNLEESPSVLINLAQNTPEWLEWRKTVIGASDTPMIMGLGTHGDMLDVFIAKVYGKEPENSFILAKGHEIEDKVRANYQITSDGDFPSVCMQKDFLGASADGWNEEKRIGLEIKYTGIANMGDEIPEKFYCQCQQQMYVFDVPNWILLRSNDGITIRKDVILRDKRYFGKKLTILKKFWARVQEYKVLNPNP